MENVNYEKEYQDSMSMGDNTGVDYQKEYEKSMSLDFEVETKYDHKAIHDMITGVDASQEITDDDAERMIKLYFASNLNATQGDQRTPDQHDYSALVHSMYGENAPQMKKSDVFKTMQKMIVPEKDAEADKYISYRDMDFEQKWEEARPDDSYDRPAQNVSAFGVKVGDDVKATEYSKEEKELIVAQYENQLRLKSPFLTKLMGKQILSPRMQKLAFDLANGVQRESMAFEFSSKMEQDIFPHYLRTLNPEIDVTGIGGTLGAVWGRSLQTEADGRESRYMSLYRGDVFDDDLVLNLKLKERDILGGYDFANGKWYGDVAKEKAQEYMDKRWLMKRDASPSFQRHGTFDDDKIDVDSPEFHERMQRGNQDYNNKKWSRLIDKATRDVYDYGKGVSGVAKTAIGEGTAMLTYMIPVMAGGIVGGKGGAMLMSGSEFYGRHMDDLIYDHGVDISRAQLNALMTAIPYAYSEQMQVGKLKQLMKAGKVSKKNADIAGDMFKKFPKFVEDKFIPLFKELAPAYFYENSQEFAQGVIERAGRLFAKEYQEAEGITFDGEMESLMEEMKMSAQATLLPVIGARMMRGADMKGGAFGNEQEARNIAEKYADLNVMSQEEANDIKKQLTPDLKVAYNEAQTFEEKQEVLDDAGLNLKVEQVEQFDNRERIVEELADQATTDIKKQFDISEQEAQSIIEDDLDTFVQSRAKMVKFAKTVDPYADLIQTGKDTATIKGKNGAELQLNLVDSMKQEGAWSPKDKTITLPRNAEDFTFTHEVTHAMRDLGLISDKEWEQVVNYGKQQFEKGSVGQFKNLDALKETYGDLVAKDADLEHEIVANVLEDWRRNGAPQDVRGKFQKVLDFFKGLIGKASDFQVTKDVYEGKPMMRKESTSTDTQSGETRFSVAPQEDSKAFKDWFGDSKVVNEDGSPMVVYHGSPDVRGIINGGFSDNYRSRKGQYFFTDSMRTANTYARDDKGIADYQNAEPHVLELYLSIQNPMIIDAKNKHWRETEKYIYEAKEKGHDGIIIKNSKDDYMNNTSSMPSTVYAVFDPSQAKSAMEGRLRSRIDGIDLGDVSNVGTYDPANPDIRFALKPLANAEVLASTYIATKQAEGKPLTDAEIEEVMTAFDIEDKSKVMANVAKIVDDEDDVIKKATHTATMRKAIASKANKLAYQDRLRGIAQDAKKGGAIYQRAEDRLRKQLKAKKLAELAGNKLSDEKTAEITESLRQVIDQGEDTKPVLKQIEDAVREEMISKGEFTKRKMAYKKDPAYRIALGNTLTEIANNLVRDLPHSRRKDSLYKSARKLKNYTSVKYMENNFDKFLDKRKKAMVVEDKKTLLKKWNKLMNSSAVKEKDKSTQEIIRSKFVKDEDGNIVAKSLHPKDRRRIQLIKQVAKLGTKAKKGDLSKLDTVISALKAYIDRASVESNEAKAELKAIELMIPAIKNFNHLDPQDRAQLALAEVVRFGGIREKSEIEIADALDAIEEDIASSFSLVEDLINDKNKRVDPMRDAIAETAGERSGKKRQKFDEYLGMAYDMRSWFDAIISKAPEGKRAEAKKHLDGLLRDWNHAIQTRDLEINKSHNEYFNAVEKIYNDEAWKITQRLEQKVDAYRKFSKLNDPMSKAQVMQLYASAVQQDYIDNAIENDRTAGQYLEVLTKEDLALIQWYRDYYADQRPSLSTKLEELTGIPINMQDPFYVPVKMKMPEADLPTEIIITKIIPDGMIQRIQHTRDFDETVSINQMWMKKVAENEHFKNVSDIAMDFRSVFSSGRVHEAISNTYGKGFKDDFMEMIQDNINDGYSGDKKIDWLDKLRGAWTASKFGFNARIGIKQLTSIPAFGFEIGLVNVGTYTASAWTPEGRKAMLEILKSDLAKDRLGKGSTEAIMNSLNESIITTDKINLQKWTKRMMVFNEWGDIVPSMIIGQGIYRSYTEHHSKTMDTAKAKETALKDLFQIIESTQQSSKLKDWSAFQRRYGSLGRMMSQFTNTTRQFLVRDFTDIRNYIDNRSSDNLKKMSSTLFINHALLPALYNGMNMIINKLMGDDIDEDDWWLMGLSMLTGPLSGYVVAGTILVGMTQGIVTGEKPWGGTSLTPFAGIKDDMISSGQIAHGILTADTEEFIRGLDDLLQSLVAPYREAKKIKKNYVD